MLPRVPRLVQVGGSTVLKLQLDSSGRGFSKLKATLSHLRYLTRCLYRHRYP